MEDVQNIGGTPGMIKFLIDNGLFDGDQMTGKYVVFLSHHQQMRVCLNISCLLHF